MCTLCVQSFIMSSLSVPKFTRTASTWVTQDADQDIKKDYLLGKQLGQPGQFGYAVQAIHKQSQKPFAVKVISKSKFSRASDRKLHYQELRNEIEVMRNMNHKNIIKMYDVYETETELYIVMELCEGGELFDRIKVCMLRRASACPRCSECVWAHVSSAAGYVSACIRSNLMAITARRTRAQSSDKSVRA